MSRKDYIAIAAAIRSHYDNADNEEVKAAIALLTSELASVLKSDNPAFDRQKFHNAALGR